MGARVCMHVCVHVLIYYGICESQFKPNEGPKGTNTTIKPLEEITEENILNIDLGSVFWAAI